MRFLPVAAFCLVGILFLSAAGVAALGGVARGWYPNAITAEIRIHQFSVPSNFKMEEQVLTDALLQQLLKRADADVALRMSLDDRTRKLVTDIIIPRLVNANVIRHLIEETPTLASIASIGNYRSIADIVVENRTDAVIRDVVMTVPSVLKAEDPTGASLDIIDAELGPGAIRVGQLQPHERRHLTGWIGQPLSQVETLGQQIRLGAAEGVNGSVYVFGQQAWLGQDLEAMPWARWVVSFLVIASGGVAAILLVLVIAFGRRARQLV